MIVVAVAALVAVAVGGVVGLIAARWPQLDPTSPGGHAAAEPGERSPDEVDEAAADRLTILGLSAGALAAVACATLFGVLVLLVRSRTGLGLDNGGARWSAGKAGPAATDVLRVLTHLGSIAVALPLVLVAGVIEARRRPSKALFGFLLAVQGGQLLLVNVVKVLVGRARPDLDRLAEVSSHSFPSAHTATAAASFAALALLTGRGRGHGTRAALAGTAAGLTALVASTRVLLGVHWITDVLAGAALGWGWAALCSVAFGGRLLRFGTTAEQAMAGEARPPSLPSRS